ncbi:sulfurtransferase TusA family protein [Acinetobacter stercoris]|uniref:Sulfur transfer protein SirA n=1 Tax=Acinetobacter stercoris TaxID=2126983 RepID=A0A2U3MVX7_9GAMM|nr:MULTISPECIES: sulfurtransferase TusA family protein [Acinetobacter]SPL69534.1 sulfur transfer protein SirA [Acinetobacter stercoris]
MTNTSHSTVLLDAMGKPCPMPLLMLKRELKQAQDSRNLLLKSSDPHSEIDILRFCQIHNLVCHFSKISENEFHYLIEII